MPRPLSPPAGQGPTSATAAPPRATSTPSHEPSPAASILNICNGGKLDLSVIASTVAVKIPSSILHKDFYCDHNDCNYLQYQVIVMKETLVKMEETALSMQEHTPCPSAAGCTWNVSARS